MGLFGTKIRKIYLPILITRINDVSLTRIWAALVAIAWTLCLVTLLHRIYNKCKHYICNKLYLYAHISGGGWVFVYRVTLNYLHVPEPRQRARSKVTFLDLPSRRCRRPSKIISVARPFSSRPSVCAALLCISFIHLQAFCNFYRHAATSTYSDDRIRRKPVSRTEPPRAAL